MKKRELTAEEREVWLEANGLVKRTKAPLASEKKSKPVEQKNKKAPGVPLTVGDTQGVDKKRTTMRPDATLDLHGLTQDKAHALVITFIKRAMAHDWRTLLIITGKGKGILRSSVPGWLDTPQLRPFILAITYATPKEGGEGALRVLLKRQR